MIAISFDNPPYTYNFTSMNGSPEERQVRGLVSARNTLGELPEEYLEKIKKKSKYYVSFNRTHRALDSAHV